MNKALALAALALCAGCATYETNPDAAPTRIADTPYCVRDTGTQVPRAGGACVSQPGHVYTQEDLDQTRRGALADQVKALLPP